MAIWFPGPWDADDEPVAQPESPHQAAIAKPEAPTPKRRTRKPLVEEN